MTPRHKSCCRTAARAKRSFLAVGAFACGIATNGCETLSGSVRPNAASPGAVSVYAKVTPPTPRSTPTVPTIVQAEGIERVPTATPSAESASIELASALELAGADNPTVNLAREAVREAEAQRLRAEALKLPSLNAGLNFNLHRGNLQRSTGSILDVERQGLYFGGGTGAVGTSTVAIPGLRLFLPLADVVAEPRAAEQRVVTRRADSAAVLNGTLLGVATTYTELVRADAELAALRLSEADFAEIFRRTKEFAKAGQGREADANRARANLELLRRQLEETEGVRTATSARLAETLNLDPSQRLVPSSTALNVIQLIDPATDLAALVNQAESSRPELIARSAKVAEARVNVRREELRPWLPTISAGASVGGFGGGGNLAPSQFGQFGTRGDFDVAAVWTVQNLGIGNHALQHRNRTVVAQASARLQETKNRIAAEVADALGQLRASVDRIAIARRQLATAEEGYAEERKRIEQGQGRPLEVLDSARSLAESRLELIRAITEHNLAQFRLLAAVGSTPSATR